LFKLNGKRRLSNLSKGKQKQAAIAFALASMPDVLLLDEPIDGLDPIARKQAMSQIMADVAERQLTVIISSHNLKEMEGICDSIGVVDAGKMAIERDLDNLRNGVLKIQVAYPPQTPRGKEKYRELGLQVLHFERLGSVEVLAARGSVDEAMEKLKSLNPLVCDILPLSLEEIFIYEMGGEGNGQ
jgi:ABC-2 type transport system ATP-binding protein